MKRALHMDELKVQITAEKKSVVSVNQSRYVDLPCFNHIVVVIM